MSAKVGLSLFVLDVTAVLLILFGFLAAVSGLCLVKPEVVEGATLGLFSSYAVCSRLHLGWTALITIVVAVIHGVAGLALIIFLVSRRGSSPPQEVGARYTHGEQEILRQLGEMKERVDKMIPPYGRVGYIPSSVEELKELLGFTYVKLGERELGERPSGLEKIEELDADFLQARLGERYVYVVRRGGKKFVAVGNQYLDYLTARFLIEFLDYI